MQSPEECHPCSDGRRICANHVGQTLTVSRAPGYALVGIVPTAAVAVGRQHSGAALNLAYKYGIHATSMICPCINLLRLNKIATRSSWYQIARGQGKHRFLSINISTYVQYNFVYLHTLVPTGSWLD